MSEQTKEIKKKEGIVVLLDALGVRNRSMDDSWDFIKKRDRILSDFEQSLQIVFLCPIQKH